MQEKYTQTIKVNLKKNKKQKQNFVSLVLGTEKAKIPQRDCTKME